MPENRESNMTFAQRNSQHEQVPIEEVIHTSPFGYPLTVAQEEQYRFLDEPFQTVMILQGNHPN